MRDCCENGRRDVRLVPLIFLPKLDTLYAQSLPDCAIDAVGQRQCHSASFKKKVNGIDTSKATNYLELWWNKNQIGHVQPTFSPLPSASYIRLSMYLNNYKDYCLQGLTTYTIPILDSYVQSFELSYMPHQAYHNANVPFRTLYEYSLL